MGDVRSKGLDEFDVSPEFAGHLFKRAGQIADFVSAAVEVEGGRYHRLCRQDNDAADDRSRARDKVPGAAVAEEFQ